MFVCVSIYEKCNSLCQTVILLLFFSGFIFTTCVVDPILFWIPIPVSVLLLVAASYVYYQNYFLIRFWCNDIGHTLKMLSQMPDEEKMYEE